MKLIAQADVVIALGSRMGPFGTLPQHGLDYWPKDAKIIQVEADHTRCSAWSRRSPSASAATRRPRPWRSRSACDGRTLASDATKAQRAATVKAEKDAWEQELDEWTHERDPYSLDMIEEHKKRGRQAGCTRARCCASSRRRCRRDVMVSTDIGNINSVANSYLRFEEPR